MGLAVRVGGRVASLSASGMLSVAERQDFGTSCDQLQLGVAVASSDGRVARYLVFERLPRTNRRRPRHVPARCAAGTAVCAVRNRRSNARHLL